MKTRATRTVALFVLMVGLCGITNYGATVVVDRDGGGDFTNIQAGIDAASEGDTVIVMPGTYTGQNNRDLSFNGKNIIVMSSDGPEATIIHCDAYFHDQHRGFIFDHGESRQAVLSGFTIREGFIGRGGAIYCHNSSPTIINNILIDNFANAGGGIAVRDQSAPVIMGNTFESNTGPRGGGIFLDSRLPGIIVANNDIVRNWSYFNFGSGILARDAVQLEIRNNLIRENYHGGGLAITGGEDILVSGNRIQNNLSHQGGGILITRASPLLINNLIEDNEALSGLGLGGGIFTTLEAGGSYYNNTIRGNQARYGGGVCIYQFEVVPPAPDFVEVDLKDCIIWGNDAHETGPQLYIENGYDVDISFCDIQGGLDDIHNEGILTWGTGNMDMDPLFTTGPEGDCYLSQISSGQGEDSSCVDAGSDMAGNICYETANGVICMDRFATRTDHLSDSGFVDIGYHYNIRIFSCTSTCLTPVVHPGEDLSFYMTTKNWTDQSETARLVTNIYLCNGAFLKEDLRISDALFDPYDIRVDERTLRVPNAVPSYMTYCDLRYEFVISDAASGRMLCSSSCVFQIQD